MQSTVWGAEVGHRYLQEERAAFEGGDGELPPGRIHVLVAKALTKSDTAGRVILPRVSVESNLSFLMGYRCLSLPCGILIGFSTDVIKNH